MASKEKPEPFFKIPWGLFAVLGVYAGGVGAYVYVNYYNAPEYKAAQHYANALALLGDDDGRSCSEKDLNRAFELILQAAVLMPKQTNLPKHLEALRYRFDERKFKLRKDFIERAEMMSANTRRHEDAKKGWLVISAYDKGWTPEQTMGGPRRAVLWSLPGAVFIVVFWAYTRFSHRAARAKEHEKKLQDVEHEVEELGEFRRGLKSAESSQSAQRLQKVSRSGVKTTGKVVAIKRRQPPE